MLNRNFNLSRLCLLVLIIILIACGGSDEEFVKKTRLLSKDEVVAFNDLEIEDLGFEENDIIDLGDNWSNDDNDEDNKSKSKENAKVALEDIFENIIDNSKSTDSCQNKSFSEEAAKYHVLTPDGRCVWSCSLGTQPNPENQQCICKEGLLKAGRDRFGRIVCTKKKKDGHYLPELCNRKKMVLWLDINSNGKIDKRDIKKGYIQAFKGDISAANNYNYYSWSAHPYYGPLAKGFESHVWFYKGSDGLSFNFFHNVDAGGSRNNKVFWKIKTTGNNLRDEILLSDDPGELKLKKVDHKKKVKSYKAKHQYWKNTDGGIIGPFEGTSFEVTVKVNKIGDVIEANFYSEDGKIISLSKKDKIRSFIISTEDHNIKK